MDTPGEQHDAAAIEEALPGSDVTVEELQTPGGAEEVAIIREGEEMEPPHDETDMAYRLGRLETRLVECEKEQAAIVAQLAAFEQATVAAVEMEAEELQQQGEVLADVAEEVLPPDHEGANTHNPDHKARKCAWWEEMLGGCH